MFPYWMIFQHTILKEAPSTFPSSNNGELTWPLKYFVGSVRIRTAPQRLGALARVKKPLNLPQDCEGLYLFPSTDICLWKYCRENASGSSNLRLKGRIFLMLIGCHHGGIESGLCCIATQQTKHRAGLSLFPAAEAVAQR